MADNEFILPNNTIVKFMCFEGDSPPEHHRTATELIEHKGAVGVAMRRIGIRGTEFELESWSDFANKSLAESAARNYYKLIGTVLRIKWRKDIVLYDSFLVNGNLANFFVMDVVVKEIMPVSLVGGIRIGADTSYVGFILKAEWNLVMSS